MFLASLQQLIGLLERAEREIVGTGEELGEDERRTRVLGLGLWLPEGDLGWTDVVAGPCRCRYPTVDTRMTGVHRAVPGEDGAEALPRI